MYTIRMPISVNKLTKIEASHRATLKAENLRRRPKKDDTSKHYVHTYVRIIGAVLKLSV